MNYETLFKLLDEVVSGEGGDGEAWVKSKNFKDIADKWEKWANAGNSHYKAREDRYDDWSMFSDGDEHSQDYVMFTSDLTGRPPWKIELIVEI